MNLATDQSLWRFRRRLPNAAEAALEERYFTSARNAESRYAQLLRQIAAQIGHFVGAHFDPTNPEDPGWTVIEETLRRHGSWIRGWAEAAARRMLADVDRRDFTAWLRHGKRIGRALRQELATAPIGPAYDQLIAQQVEAISGISTEAADRVAGLAAKARTIVPTGARWNSIVQEVMAQEGVSRAHANTIARTETARAHTTLTAVRAQHIGSEYFRWRTAHDADVRPLHRQIARTNGGVYRWNDPPTLDDGRPGLPGTIWNCRCFAEPLLQDEAPTPRAIVRSPEYIASLRPEAAPINEQYRRGHLTYGEYMQRLLSL